ncbi:MAG: hypothetical protein ACYTFH_10675, partial [Planctomycetota bacterium]
MRIAVASHASPGGASRLERATSPSESENTAAKVPSIAAAIRARWIRNISPKRRGPSTAARRRSSSGRRRESHHAVAGATTPKRPKSPSTRIAGDRCTQSTPGRFQSSMTAAASTAEGMPAATVHAIASRPSPQRTSRDRASHAIVSAPASRAARPPAAAATASVGGT